MFFLLFRTISNSFYVPRNKTGAQLLFITLQLSQICQTIVTVMFIFQIFFISPQFSLFANSFTSTAPFIKLYCLVDSAGILWALISFLKDLIFTCAVILIFSDHHFVSVFSLTSSFTSLITDGVHLTFLEFFFLLIGGQISQLQPYCIGLSDKSLMRPFCLKSAQ